MDGSPASSSYVQHGFPIDSFINDAIESTLDAVRDNPYTDFLDVPKILSQRYGQYMARGVSDSVFAALYRPVYWQLCLDDLVKRTDAPYPTPSFRVKRVAPIGFVVDTTATSRVEQRSIREDILREYRAADTLFEMGKNGLLIYEIKERYLELYQGILGKYNDRTNERGENASAPIPRQAVPEHAPNPTLVTA